MPPRTRSAGRPGAGTHLCLVCGRPNERKIDGKVGHCTFCNKLTDFCPVAKYSPVSEGTRIPPECINGEVSERLKCAVCNEILHVPLRTPCDHMFCMDCILQWLANNSICPVDRSPVTRESLRTDPIIRQLIGDTPALCKNAPMGCEWQGDISGWAAHTAKCQWHSAPCDHCDAPVSPTMKAEHLKTCKLRPRACPFCAQGFLGRNLDRHLEECTEAPVRCVCGQPVLPANLQAHMTEPGSLRKHMACMAAIAEKQATLEAVSQKLADQQEVDKATIAAQKGCLAAQADTISSLTARLEDCESLVRQAVGTLQRRQQSHPDHLPPTATTAPPPPSCLEEGFSELPSSPQNHAGPTPGRIMPDTDSLSPSPILSANSADRSRAPSFASTNSRPSMSPGPSLSPADRPSRAVNGGRGNIGSSGQAAGAATVPARRPPKNDPPPSDHNFSGHKAALECVPATFTAAPSSSHKDLSSGPGPSKGRARAASMMVRNPYVHNAPLESVRGRGRHSSVMF